MDPLSQVLSLLRLDAYVSGGFVVPEHAGLQCGRYEGLKCYAVVAGACWLAVEDAAEPLRIETGTCVLLPSGRPFCLATDLSAPRTDFHTHVSAQSQDGAVPCEVGSGCSMLGGHFLLGSHGAILLDALAPIVPIRTDASKAAMRWLLECLREELRDRQPGAVLIAQQLSTVLLLQALRLHLTQNQNGVGWLFGLVDPHLKAAMACMHEHPRHAWTIQALADRVGMSRTVFAQRFKAKVGLTSMEYLAQWRMQLASDRLKHSAAPIAMIARSVGYETESAFGKAFRRAMNSSPRAFRKAHRTPLPGSEAFTPRPVPSAARLSLGFPGPCEPPR